MIDIDSTITPDIYNLQVGDTFKGMIDIFVITVAPKECKGPAATGLVQLQAHHNGSPLWVRDAPRGARVSRLGHRARARDRAS